MADEAKAKITVPKAEVSPEQALEAQAIEWALGLDAKGICPVCSHTPAFGDADEKKNAIKSHLREKHLSRILIGFVNGKDIDAVNTIHMAQTSELDAKVPVVEGVDVIDDHLRYNLFELPRVLERNILSDGAKIHFSSPDKVSYWQDRGFELVPGKSVHNTTKVNEMVAMRVPNRVWLRRAEAKRSNIDNSLPARKENSSRNMNEIGRQAYDAAQRRGLTSDQSMNIAHSVERGVMTGKITIQDRKGERKY